jgi:hypothetical protein
VLGFSQGLTFQNELDEGFLPSPDRAEEDSAVLRTYP